jgi:predicted dehydrogenase
VNDPRVCIVGAGGLSSRRIYPYVGAAGAELVGVCDMDEQKAQTNARRFGGKPFTNMDAMLDATKPDGVIICIGPAQHAKLAPAVMKRGIAVYTEKPPAPTAAEALEVARVAKQTNVLCMTGFKKRYSTAFARARQWVDQFEPSRLLSISVDYASGGYANNDNFLAQFLLDFAVHHIDLIGYLFGDVAEVFTFAKGQNAYAGSLRFANGAVGTMNLNDGRSFSIPTEELELTATGGNFMTIRNSSFWRIVANGQPTEWREPPTFTSGGDSGNDTGHLAELVEFFSAVKEGRKTTRSDIYEAYKSMELYEAIRDSAQTGEKVRVMYQSL